LDDGLRNGLHDDGLAARTRDGSADNSARHAANNGPDGAADDRACDGAAHQSGCRAVAVSEGKLRQDDKRRAHHENEHILSHESLLARVSQPGLREWIRDFRGSLLSKAYSATPPRHSVGFYSRRDASFLRDSMSEKQPFQRRTMTVASTSARS
jgi:hypothetical protein